MKGTEAGRKQLRMLQKQQQQTLGQKVSSIYLKWNVNLHSVLFKGSMP